MVCKSDIMSTPRGNGKSEASGQWSVVVSVKGRQEDRTRVVKEGPQGWK
jgi:hypothetical protein